MKAIRYQGLRRLTLDSMVFPLNLPDDSVRISIQACGVCGSDIAKIMKSEPSPGYLKTDILGHEVVGRIIECGKKVNSSLLGSRVAIEPLFVCGECKSCTTDRSQFCEKISVLGRDVSGGFASELVAPVQFAWPLSHLISDDLGTLLDSLAVVIHGFSKVTEGIAQRNILVLGDGPLGLLSVAYAKACGASRIVIYGKHSARLTLGKTLGADESVLVDHNSQLQDNHRKAFDLVIESVGGQQAKTLTWGIESVNFCGDILVFGVFESKFYAEILARNLFYKEIRLLGVNSFVRSARHMDFQAALRFLETHGAALSALITHRFNLEDTVRLFEVLKNPETHGFIKGVIKP